MLLSQCIAWNLLVLLLLQPSFGLVLNRDKRQADASPDPDADYAGLRSWFADDDYQELTGYAEAAHRQRGASRLLIPSFGKPLDRIFSEKRTTHRTRNLPRRRMSPPVDQIGGSYLPHRRGWSDYPDTDWDYYEDEVADSRTETNQQ